MNALSVCVSIISFSPHPWYMPSNSRTHHTHKHKHAHVHVPRTHTVLSEPSTYDHTANNNMQIHTHTGPNVTHIHDKVHFRQLCLSSMQPTGRPSTHLFLPARPPVPPLDTSIPFSMHFNATALYSNKIASIHYFESIPGYTNTPKIAFNGLLAT